MGYFGKKPTDIPLNANDLKAGVIDFSKFPTGLFEKTTTYTATGSVSATDQGLCLVDATSGSIILTLPAANSSTTYALKYKFIRIDNTTANTVTIQRAGSDTIDGVATSVRLNGIGDYESLQSNMSNGWRSDEDRYNYNVGRKNAIINGNFDIWQRNTTFTNPSNGAYTADRWLYMADGTPGNHTVTRQSFTLGQTSVPGEPVYFIRLDVTATSGSTSYHGLAQRIESVRSFAGKTIVVSFYAKASGNITITPYVTQNFGGSSPVDAIGSAISITTSWSKYQSIFNVASISGKTLGSNDNLEISFRMDDTVQTLDIAQVQVEEGSVATNFERRTFADELKLCQRYYEKSFALETAPAQNVGVATGETTPMAGKAAATAQFGDISFKTSKRAVPATITTYNPAAANAQVRDITASVDCSAVATANASIRGFRVTATGNASTAVGNILGIHWTAEAEL